MKTQIRFAPSDLEIWTRKQGTSDPFRSVPMEELVDIALIPKYDHTIQWRKKVHRPARRKVNYPEASRHRRGTHTISRESSKGQSSAKKPKLMVAGAENMDIQPEGIIDNENESL